MIVNEMFDNDEVVEHVDVVEVVDDDYGITAAATGNNLRE